jgi:guanylate kinase
MKAAYEEVKNKGLYDHIVVNDAIDKAVERLLLILDGTETRKGPRTQ